MKTVLALLLPLLLLVVAIIAPIMFVAKVASPKPTGEKVVGMLKLPNGQVIPVTFDVMHNDKPIVVEPTTAAQALDEAKSRARLWLQQL